MAKLVKRAILVVGLLILTPFALGLSLVPPYKGPREWFEFCMWEIKRIK